MTQSDALSPEWADDPRNTVYMNNRGKVFRAYPVSKTEVILFDVTTNHQIKMTNSEVGLSIREGDLIEIDPFQAMVLPTGKTGARKFIPEQVSEPGGAGSPLVGKYKAASRRDSQDAHAAPTAQDTGAAAAASRRSSREPGEACADPLLRPSPAPVRKYIVRRTT